MIEELIRVVRAAGEEILKVYRSDFAVRTKADDSPVTEADLRAHRAIARGLLALAPAVPIISEEATPPPFRERRRWLRHWLVDPLDGTREFIDRNGEFTVNVALVEAGVPVLGVVGAPARDVVYCGDRRATAPNGGAAFRLDAAGRTPLAARPMRPDRVTVVASRRHGGERLTACLDALAERFEVSRVAVGSSLKLCVLAAGEADLYPRLAPTSEWDIAAGHAVLAASGGEVLRVDGGTLAYNAQESLLNPDFVAVADPSFAWRRLLAAASAGDSKRHASG